ncbi:alpha-1,4-glucan--maltose-1-phosphate maltosyltransferase [Euzebya tangerina]|uniref:alpha-1,4-glucan--maltose-1-phosphate maltosyltransferase n=1 Tax=Euzebya tangerina TaxID=591198 RepID=UPI000E313997|nr:alpha-1,4-glucan--maltose-1-phosphate maltosyltransferase [Euzebya tangerina]
MKHRIQIASITPAVDGGRYPVKTTVGRRVDVSATLFREGHAMVAAGVRYRREDATQWDEAPLRRTEQDGFAGSFEVDSVGSWVYEIIGWTDHYASWLDGLVKKHRAGVADLALEFEQGAILLESHAKPAGVPSPAPELLEQAAQRLRDSSLPTPARVDVARDEELLATLARHPDRRDLTPSMTMPLWVDREKAGFSAWYEFFPRSIGSDGTSSGTFRQAEARLPEVAAMGFDVLYLPPIHPIGTSHRKGPNNTLNPGPDDPGVPWAIGSEAGGHMSVHPDLGTLEDFDHFLAAAEASGLEIALDYAIQCSPDHPWVTEHPEWFDHKPDGSIAYAENPPKKYQDIYPISFDTPDLDGLIAELKRILEFWIARGVKIFRVDNPHTKAVPFWEWVIAEIHASDPDVIFLAEAFTKPHMMQQLAKVGFTQSYTYFTWRNTRWELETYLTELAHGPMANYYRPNFWPNTPDILHEYLQSGAPAAFKVRATLAATMSPNYGMYSGYELLEHVPVRPGSEEYLNSEKYAYRPRNFDVDHSIAPFITRLNEIRRSNPEMLSDLTNIWFHGCDNEQLIVYSKTAGGRRLPNGPVPTDALLVVANLDPHNVQQGFVHLDLWQLGLDTFEGPYLVHDLIRDTSWTWHGSSNWIRLDPHHEDPVHVFRIRVPHG